MSKLQELHDLLETSWTQNAYARDANGHPCSFNDEDAVCFCLMGGAYKIGVSDREQSKLREKTPLKNLVEFNDHHSKEEVLGLIKSCI